MILESILPCTYLLLTSGHSLYALKVYDDNSYSPCFFLASVGITAIWIRSANVLVYKYFFKTYALDPELIEEDEEASRHKISVLDEILGNVSTSSLVWSLYCYERYPIIGACVVVTVSFYDLLRLRNQMFLSENSSSTENSFRGDDIASYKATSKLISVLWILITGWFAWTVGNNYALAANFPYMVTTLAFPVESFYQGWTLKRSINDYMMMAYVVLMTEAFHRKSPQ